MKKSNRIFWSGIGFIFVCALSVILVFSLLGRAYAPSSELHKMHREISSQEAIKGNGKIANVQKDLPQFNKLFVSGSYAINVIPGNTSKLMMESDDNILNKIKIEVKEGELKIMADRSTRLLPSSSVKITIITPELLDVHLAGDIDLSALTLNSTQLKVNTAGHNNVILKGQINKMHLGLSGASNINLKEIINESIEINSAGASDIQISGFTDSLNINNDGTIYVKAKNLAAKNVSVAGAGSTNVDVHAINQIMLNTVGKASIHYSGNPKVINHFAGSMKLSND